MMYALYQQLELSARNRQRKGFEESEQHWLAQQEARQQSRSGWQELTFRFKALFSKKRDNHARRNDPCHQAV